MSALFLSSVKRMLPYILFLYVFSLEASMAGMEAFGWLGFLLTLAILPLEFKKEPLKSYLKHWTVAEFCLVGFFIVVILGAIFNSPEPTDRLFTMGRTRGILLLFGLKFLVLLTFGKKTEKLFYVLFGVATLASLNAIFQYFTGVDIIRPSNEAIEKIASIPPVYRTIGFFNSSMTFAHSIGALIALPFAFALVNPYQNRRSRMAFLLVTLLMGLALVTTFTRGAWLGAVSAILFVALLREWKTMLATIGAMTLIVFTVTKIHPSLEMRVRTTFDTHTQSATERMTLWQANTKIFTDYPLLGVGYGENERVVSEYFQKFHITSGFIGHAHSNFFQFLAGTGAIGTLFFYLFCLLMFVLNLKLWFKVSDRQDWISAATLGILGVQVCLHVGGLTECNFKDMEINHLFVFFFAMLLALNYKIQREKFSVNL